MGFSQQRLAVHFMLSNYVRLGEAFRTFSSSFNDSNGRRANPIYNFVHRVIITTISKKLIASKVSKLS